jgi:hypothetical protein
MLITRRLHFGKICSMKSGRSIKLCDSCYPRYVILDVISVSLHCTINLSFLIRKVGYNG